MSRTRYPEPGVGLDDNHAMYTIGSEAGPGSADRIGKDALGRLTDGQKECLRLVRENRTSKDIGRILELSPHTVDMRIRAAMRILSTPSRGEAAREFAAYEADEKSFEDRTVVRSDVQVPPDVATEPQKAASDAVDEEWAWDQIELPWGSLNTMSKIERVAWMAALVTSSTLIFTLLVMILRAIKPAI